MARTRTRAQQAGHAATEAAAPASPWRNPDFRTLFTGTALSQLGSNVCYLAVPLVAVSALDASPAQIGALSTLSTLAFLLIGLPAGAWVDRMRQRRLMIVADLGRGLLFASVPVAWWLDVLSLAQLYAVVFLAGCATVFFDVASQTVVPQLVRRDELVPANAALVSLMGLGGIAGRSAGGGLVQLLTLPYAVLAAAAGYLASALTLTRVKAAPAPPRAASATTPRVPLRTQIGEGLRHVLGHAELRALAATGALLNFGNQLMNTMLPLLFVRELGLSAAVLGLYWSAGGVGMLLGARNARRIAGRFGYGRTLGLAGACLAPAGLLLPLVGREWWLLLIAGFGGLAMSFKTGVDNVLGVTLRQRLTPDAMLGRMNATFRFLFMGALAIGAAVSGVLAEATSVRTVLWVGGAFMATAFLPVFLSPVRRRRALPDGP
ncbi:MFS transporter [Streptomyces sp. NPDC050095]|uniref:MFS transporter n=1 Tax=unclassified Streptomyces TaxID=2593676 RepID=UPI00342B817A